VSEQADFDFHGPWVELCTRYVSSPATCGRKSFTKRWCRQQGPVSGFEREIHGRTSGLFSDIYSSRSLLFLLSFTSHAHRVPFMFFIR